MSKRWQLGLILALLVGFPQPIQASPKETAPRTIQVEWSIRPFSSQFWMIDQLSGWDPQLVAPKYHEYLEPRLRLDRASVQLLGQYAQLRRMHSMGDPPPAQGDVKAPLGDRLVSPPRLPYEPFALAFLTSSNVEQATKKLNLSPDETALVKRVFARFTPQMTPILKEDSLAGVSKAMQRLAQQAHLTQFLEEEAAFYGSGMPSKLTVDLLWAPEGVVLAQCYQNHVLLPVAAADLSDEKGLARRVGAIAHEMGHYLAGRMPEARRLEMTNRQLEKVGLPDVRRPNLLDEAIETALGNIFFMRNHLPQYLDDARYYMYDPESEFPYGIDELARRLEPILRTSFKPGGFPVFFEKALDEMQGLFGAMPRLHTRVGLLLAENQPIYEYFDGIFLGLSRWQFMLDEEEDFLKFSAENPHISRWMVLTVPALTPERIQQLGGAPLTSLVAQVKRGGARAGFLARRRSPEGGYDFWLVGKDREAVREALIRLYRYEGLPEQPVFF